MILSAPPGAGKSTYLPLALLKAPQFAGRKILMLQPRRVAVRSIAARLASQLGESVGQTVGYRVRGEKRVGNHTRLEILTEGLLTRRLQTDPGLTGVALVIFDEFHERNLHGDLALAFTLESQQTLREDLRVLLMSATLEQHSLQALLPGAIGLRSEGRSFDVDVRYQPLDGKRPLVPQIARVIRTVIATEAGSILVFLPGGGEIRAVAEQVEDGLPDDMALYPLYGELDKDSQMAAINPTREGRRKLVLATNIAETSLTIDGVRLVIDSGLERSAWFDPKRGLTKLKQQKISQASATQRAGRAGRTQAGVCIRLWAKEQQDRLDPQAVPEMLRSDMSQPTLEAANWGTPLTDLALLNMPTQAQTEVAVDLLQRFEAISTDGGITPHGRLLCQSGTHPRFAHMLVNARELASVIDSDPNDTQWMACVAAAVLEGESRRGESPELERRIEQVLRQPKGQLYRQASSWARRFGVSITPSLPLAHLGVVVSAGFPDRIGKASHRGRYQLSGGGGACLAEGEKLADQQWLLAPGLFATDVQQGDAAITCGVPVDIDTVTDLYPHWLTLHNLCHWQGERLDIRRVSQLGKIELSSEKVADPDDNVMAELWRDEIRRRGIQALPMSDKALLLLQRARLASTLMPEAAQWPQLSDSALLATLDRWCLPMAIPLKSWGALNTLDWVGMIKGLLPWACQQIIDEQVPTHFRLPTGRAAQLHYHKEGEVTLSVKLQELFGLSEHPSVAGGRLPILVELLSPAQRPIQLTKDLPGFWQGSYQAVKKDMKGRYPKHPWPDDPANAIPTHKTKNALAREQQAR